MVEGEATTFGSFSESDSDSILSGSVCYSTGLSEDSEAELDLSEEIGGEVLPYHFEPERYSGTYSESEDEAAVLTSSSGEERIGNTDWYVTKMYFVVFRVSYLFSDTMYTRTLVLENC